MKTECSVIKNMCMFTLLSKIDYILHDIIAEFS